MRYLVLFLLISLQATAINVRGGDIFLVRPDSPYIDSEYVPAEFLSVEDLVFYTCIEENLPVKSTVICMDDNSFKDVTVTRWLEKENCYIGTYDLDAKDCRQMIIQSEYEKDDELITVQREIKVNRLSSILDLVTRNQYSDGGWRDAVDTASGIWVLSNYKNIYDDELEMGIDWLKLNRDNEYKCWPKDDCSVRTTAKIMAYLALAGLNDTYRIVHDGIVYLENMQNFYTDEERWNLKISPFESGTTSCIISYERDLLNEQNFSVEQNSIVNFTISPYPGDELIVLCDQNFKANLTTSIDEEVFIYEGDNMSYITPENCWSSDSKWGDCDMAATLFATVANVSDDSRELSLEYLKKQLVQERAGEKSIKRKVNYSALYAYVADNKNVTSWLRYKQNNDGSWGNNSDMRNIITTGYSLLGMLASGFNRTDEVIEDAEEWVNDRELDFILNITSEYKAWNSTERNALAFIVLRNNARPVIKSNPMLVLIDNDAVDVELYNPTTFDLDDITFKFSDNLKDILEIEEQEYIPSYSYVRQTITRKKAETGNIYGYLSVFNGDEELGMVPVTITNFPKIEIESAKDNFIVFGTSAKIDFKITKTAHRFDCDLAWDDTDISSKEEYTLDSNSLSVDVSFTSAERVEKTYKGTFSCVSGEHSFDVPVDVRVSRYSDFPFEVIPSEIFVNDTNPSSIIIENRLDETLDVKVELVKASSYFELARTTVAIDPNNKVNISIYNNVPATSNVTESNMIKVTGLEQIREVSFRADITAVPEKRRNPFVMYSLLGLLIVLLAVGGYFAYKYRDNLKSLLKKGSNIDEVKVRIKKLEEKEKQTAIMNMINILRILKQDDVQIRTRLKAENFSDEEIDNALKSDAESADDTEESYS